MLLALPLYAAEPGQADQPPAAGAAAPTEPTPTPVEPGTISASPAPAATPAPAAPPPPTEAQAPAAPAAAADGSVTGSPAVVDTATLVIDGRLVSLYGIVGLYGPAAAGLQQYVDASGGSVTCHPQGETQHVCLLPNNTDVAMAALINGAALLGPDAPASYVAERNDGVRNHRGMWGACSPPAFEPPPALPPELVSAYLARLSVNPLFTVEQLGEREWAIDGVPYALIDGGFRGIAFEAGRGWGFHDRDGRWHDAPERLRADLERTHPHGEGLRHEAGIRAEDREQMHGEHGHEAGRTGERGGREAGLHRHEGGHEAGGFHGGHGFTRPHAATSFHATGGRGGGRKNH